MITRSLYLRSNYYETERSFHLRLVCYTFNTPKLEYFFRFKTEFRFENDLQEIQNEKLRKKIDKVKAYFTLFRNRIR